MIKWEHVKRFWTKKIKDMLGDCNVKNNELSVSDWEKVIWEKVIDKTTDFQELNELGRKLVKEIHSKSFFTRWIKNTLLPEEEEKLQECLFKDLIEIKKQINILSTEKTLSRLLFKLYGNVIKEFQSKIKAMIGDDLTNWETKIVKIIADLKKKIADLTTQKDELEKKLKEQQQIPNDDELNQTKKALDELTKERDKLNDKLINFSSVSQLKSEEKKTELVSSPKQLEEKKSKNKNDEIKRLIKNGYDIKTIFLTGIISSFLGGLMMFIIIKNKTFSKKNFDK